MITVRQYYRQDYSSISSHFETINQIKTFIKQKLPEGPPTL